jgi:probable F420-dependent oxidoreductase
VFVLPYRHGVLTARMLASLDQLSSGRLLVGVGAGWNAEESRILGLPFEQRGPMTDEWIRVMRELWTSPEPSFEGQFTSFADVVVEPRPIQQPYPPIWVGGASPAALRRTVEFGDAWHPINRSPAQFREGVEQLQRLCERFNRSTMPMLAPRLDARLLLDDKGGPAPAHAGHLMEGTAAQMIEQVEEFRSMGVEHLVLEFTGRDVENYFDQIEAFATDVKPHFAA